MCEAEEETSQDITCASKTAWTGGGYSGDGDEWGPVRGTLTTRGSSSMPLGRSACVQGNGDELRSFASNEGRTRGTYGTYMAVGERGMRRRLLSPDSRRGVRVRSGVG